MHDRDIGADYDDVDADRPPWAVTGAAWCWAVVALEGAGLTAAGGVGAVVRWVAGNEMIVCLVIAVAGLATSVVFGLMSSRARHGDAHDMAVYTKVSGFTGVGAFLPAMFLSEEFIPKILGLAEPGDTVTWSVLGAFLLPVGVGTVLSSHAELRYQTWRQSRSTTAMAEPPTE